MANRKLILEIIFLVGILLILFSFIRSYKNEKKEVKVSEVNSTTATQAVQTAEETTYAEKETESIQQAETEISTESPTEVSNEMPQEAESPDYDVQISNFSYMANSIGTVEFCGILEVTNTGNTNLDLESCIYDLEDNNGHLLQTEDWISAAPEIIAPGEKGYFYNNIESSSLNDGVPIDNGVNLKPHYDIESTKSAFIDYEISDTSMVKEQYLGTPIITGRITNSTDADNSYVEIYILFLDASGKVIDVGNTNVSDLKAGETKSFECSSMFMMENIADAVTDYKVIARTEIFSLF